MHDLAEQIRRYVDGVAPPIARDELPRLPERGRRSWVVAGSVAAAAAIVVGIVVLAQDRRDVVGAGPGTDPGTAATSATTADADDLAWLTPLGEEASAPLVPEGWTVVDVADFRFAVPPGWVAPLAESCAVAVPEATGLILVKPDPQGVSCGETAPLPESWLSIERVDAPGSEPGVPTTVGTFAATNLPDNKCTGCPVRFGFENGFQLRIKGPDTYAVLATLTDSGFRRALQAGAVADTSAWGEVEYGGVRFKVPASWGRIDLPGSVTVSTTPDGLVASTGGLVNPDVCRASMFRPSESPTVWIGTSPISPSCPPILVYDLEAADGVWIRPVDLADPGPSPFVTEGRIGGLDVDVVVVERPSKHSSVLDLLISGPEGTLSMSIGVGPDPSIARAILRSLRAAG